MDLNINNLKDLYDRLKPALSSKLEEVKKAGSDYIEEIDIWNYLKKSKWENSHNLLLHQMVDDILSLDKNIIMDYYKNKKSE